MVCNKRFSAVHIILSCLLVVTGIGTILLASTPPFSRDALTHHLAIPKLYLQHGGIYEIPNLKFSYYPMNLDLLYMIPLSFGNDILPKYFHAFFAFATATLIFLFLKKRLSDVYGLLGALFFLTIPIIVKLSITVYVDLGLIFFSFSSLLLIISWLEKQRLSHLLLAGFCCGLAVGTKYNGLITFLILTACLPFFSARQTEKPVPFRTIVTATFVFCFFALLACSPWLIRNYLWTGNPIYPLYDTLFNASQVTAETTSASQVTHSLFAYRQVMYGETWWQMALLPLRIFFEGMDGDPRLFDGRLNPFLLLLPLLTFFVPRGDKKNDLSIQVLTTFVILYFLFAFFSSALRIRYLGPIIPSLVVLAMLGMNNLLCYIETKLPQSSTGNYVFLVCAASILLPNYLYISDQYTTIKPLQYISGRISRNEYLRLHRPDYSTKNYADNNLPDNAKLLCFFMGARGYYLSRPHIFAEPFSDSMIAQYIQQGSLAAALRYLKREKITHFLVCDGLLIKTINALDDENEKKRWSQLFQENTTKIYTAKGYSLYKLKL